MWIARSTRRVEITAADIAATDRIWRRLDVTLRMPDALHIAITGRLDATLVTFDHIMATAARVSGMAVATP
jgi:predicted nucleic acid-binding protein